MSNRVSRRSVVGATLAATTFLPMSMAVAVAAEGSAGEEGVVSQRGTFTTWDESTEPAAVTYDERVPEGATASVVATYTEDGDSSIELAVEGLVPDRTYAAHVHVASCGATGDAAGPHYQDEVDPTPSSLDPDFANPDNEVWLDFTTDGSGDAVSTSQVAWQFRQDGANSVVIHERGTSTEGDMAGEAGSRFGCLTVPFSSVESAAVPSGGVAAGGGGTAQVSTSPGGVDNTGLLALGGVTLMVAGGIVVVRRVRGSGRVA